MVQNKRMRKQTFRSLVLLSSLSACVGSINAPKSSGDNFGTGDSTFSDAASNTDQSLGDTSTSDNNSGDTGSSDTDLGTTPAQPNCSPAVGGASALALTQIADASDGIGNPVLAISPAGDNTRLFVVDRGGRIRLRKDGVFLSEDFLDMGSPNGLQLITAGGEQGLLGLAFHPNYNVNGRFFVYYTDNTGGDTQIDEFHRSVGNEDVADPATRTPILGFSQPQSNHNGGSLAFGPDGLLYIGAGDGGSSGDGDGTGTDGHAPQGNGQSTSTMLGKILRIDIDAPPPYGIPPGNMTGAGVLPEVYDWGLRNPWRTSFDVCDGHFYIGDVGQNNVEEIDVHPTSLVSTNINWGWRCYEGSAVYDLNSCSTAIPSIYTPPIAEYNHSNGCAIVGGYVYRGSAIPGLRGTYFYGDACSGRVWSFRSNDGLTRSAITEVTADLVVYGAWAGFGQDAAGELYLCDINGFVYRLDAE